MKKIIGFFKAAWLIYWWALASSFLWAPISIAGIFSPTGRLAFKICQLWVWLGKGLSFVRIEKKNTEIINPQKTYMIICNHQSLYDIPALMLGLGTQFRWVIKKSYMYVPMFGWALYLAKHVFIDRSNVRASIKSMDDAVKNLPKGVSVAVFPEGTRSDTGELKEFKSGGFLTAIRNNMTILPVTINGSWRIMPNKKSMNFFPGPIEVIVSEPIETEGYTRKNMRELIEKTKAAVAENLNPDYPQK